MFRIGQEVYCVDHVVDSLHHIQLKPTVYTIRGFYKDGSIYLNEVVNKAMLAMWSTGPDFAELSYKPERFRPLSDVLAEISIAELVEEVVEC